MHETLDLILERDGDATRLLSPGVGLFTCAVPPGGLLGPGQDAGVLLVLGRPLQLRVPAGVAGRVTSPLPQRVQSPVDYRATLYELEPVESALDAAQDAEAAFDGGLVLRAPQAGRFYHRPGPDEPAFVSSGDEVSEGDAVGLIEVMKTFAHVTYASTGGLPARAKVKRYLKDDGAEVSEGEPLLEFED